MRIEVPLTAELKLLDIYVARWDAQQIHVMLLEPGGEQVLHRDRCRSVSMVVEHIACLLRDANLDHLARVDVEADEQYLAKEAHRNGGLVAPAPDLDSR
jgi:hypothetical protein